MISGKSTIAFVIGGSLGHGEEMLDRANFRLSFTASIDEASLSRTNLSGI